MLVDLAGFAPRWRLSGGGEAESQQFAINNSDACTRFSLRPLVALRSAAYGLPTFVQAFNFWELAHARRRRGHRGSRPGRTLGRTIAGRGRRSVVVLEARDRVGGRTCGERAEQRCSDRDGRSVGRPDPGRGPRPDQGARPGDLPELRRRRGRHRLEQAASGSATRRDVRTAAGVRRWRSVGSRPRSRRSPRPCRSAQPGTRPSAAELDRQTLDGWLTANTTDPLARHFLRLSSRRSARPRPQRCPSCTSCASSRAPGD